MEGESGLPSRDQLKAFVRAQLEVVDELTKEREAARAVDEAVDKTLDAGPGRSPRYVVRRLRWYHWLLSGTWLYLVAVVLHLVTAGAVIAIALRVYGLR